MLHCWCRPSARCLLPRQLCTLLRRVLPAVCLHAHTLSRSLDAVVLLLLQAPGVDADFGEDAARALWDLVGGSRPLTAYVERRERIPAAGKQWGVQVRRAV